jgi:hypothetical protein
MHLYPHLDRDFRVPNASGKLKEIAKIAGIAKIVIIEDAIVAQQQVTLQIINFGDLANAGGVLSNLPLIRAWRI